MVYVSAYTLRIVLEITRLVLEKRLVLVLENTFFMAYTNEMPQRIYSVYYNVFSAMLITRTTWLMNAKFDTISQWCLPVITIFAKVHQFYLRNKKVLVVTKLKESAFYYFICRWKLQHEHWIRNV